MLDYSVGSENVYEGDISVREALEIAKPFTALYWEKDLTNLTAYSSRKDLLSILKKALVTQIHVVASNSHYAIRIRHDDIYTFPMLYDYKKNEDDININKYPSATRLFPAIRFAEASFSIDVNDWLEAHKQAFVQARNIKNKIVRLEGKTITVHSASGEIYKYNLKQEHSVPQEVAYNCKYMINILKAFKRAGIEEVTLYFFGKWRALYFHGRNVEASLATLRAY